MRRVSILLVLATLGSLAVARATPCDEDPSCNQGRGHVPGYVCWRNEASPIPTGEGNGRICVEHPEDGDEYVYTRGLSNTRPIVICRDGARAFPPPEEGEQNPNYVCGPM